MAIDPRSTLYGLMGNPHRTNIVKDCLKELTTRRASSTPATLDKDCEGLADALILKIKSYTNKITDEAAVKDYLVLKAKKMSRSDPSSPMHFKSLEILLRKISNNKMLDATQKSELALLKQNLQNHVDHTNDFLRQAQKALQDATDSSVTTNMDKTLWNNLQPFLSPYKLSSRSDLNDPFMDSLKGALGLPSAMDAAVKKESHAAVKNYLANLGTFLAHFAPYYNEFWKLKDSILQKRNESASGEKLITERVCNILLKAGGEPEIKNLPGLTDPIPAFKTVPATSSAPAAGSTPPVTTTTPSASGPPKIDAVTILCSLNGNAKLPLFLADIDTFLKDLESSYSNLGGTKGYDEANKMFLDKPIPAHQLPLDPLAAETFKEKVRVQQREVLVEFVITKLNDHKLIKGVNKKAIEAYLTTLVNDFNEKNQIASAPFNELINHLKNGTLPATGVKPPVNSAPIVPPRTNTPSSPSGKNPPPVPPRSNPPSSGAAPGSVGGTTPTPPKTVIQLKRELDTQITDINAYLKGASEALTKATDKNELVKDNVDPNDYEMFFKFDAYTRPLDTTGQLSQVLKHIVNDEAAFVQKLQKLRNEKDFDKKSAMINFYANLGKFIAHLSPHYNHLWELEDQIRTLESNPLADQPSITLGLCNAFLETGKVAPLTQLPTNPTTIPVFTKAAAATTPTPPPGNPPAPPINPPKTPDPAGNKPPVTPTPPTTNKDDKKVPPKPAAKGNRFIAMIKAPFVWVGSLMSRFWNWLFGAKKS